MKPFLNRLKDIWSRLLRIFWIRFAVEVGQRFGKDNGGLLAAGLAFFLILAFVPMLLVGLWVLGHFYVNKPDEAVVQIQSLISSQLLPGAAGNEVNHLMARAGIVAAEGSQDPGPTLMNLLHKSGLAGIIGLLSLVWAAIQIFINGSTAMNAAWETTEKRSWVRLRLVALGLLIGAGILVVLSLAATGLSTHISASPIAREVPLKGLLLSVLAEVFAIVVSAVMYTVIYKFLPSAQVSWKAAFVGGTLAAVAWEVVKKGLAVYLLHPNKSLYGELGGLIIFVLLVYYSMMVLLIGAEASAVYAHQVEQNPLSRLKSAERFTPSADTSASSGTPPARAKERNGTQRTRKSSARTGSTPRR
jgi:membrane protein